MSTPKVETKQQPARGIRFSIRGESGEIARAYLYIMTNDLHDAPFGRASRPKVHELYERLGFTNYGIEFRMNRDA
jgi:hypothetical protein